MSQFELAQLKLRISPEAGLFARDFATIVTELDLLYANILVLLIEPWPSRSQSLSQRIPSELRLKLVYLRFGSNAELIVEGAEKALDSFKDLVVLIRDWKQQRRIKQTEAEIADENLKQEREKTRQEAERTAQLREKTHQERQRTMRMKLDNLQATLEILRSVDATDEQKDRILRRLYYHARKIEKSPSDVEPL